MNPILEKIKQAVLQKKPQLQPVIEKIVEQGQRVMYDPKTRGMMSKQLANGADPEAIGEGVAKLMGILYTESRKTMPMEASVPAATILLCEALQFLEDAGVVKVDNNMLAQCMKAMSSALLQLFGVSEQRLQSMIAKKGG